jgi:DNA-binding LacI/PurR family transcriptional regulator
VDTTTERLDGYRRALEAHNISFNEKFVVKGQSRIRGGYHGITSLMELDDSPTAIFSTNNLMTLGALHAFRDLGLSVPGDVGLIGFDDHDWADIFTPPLTVVRQPTFEMGVEAARLLAVRMKSEQKSVSEEIKILDGELVVRGSCSKKCLLDFNKAFQPD